MTRTVPAGPGVYCIKNLLNGKVYIGSSKDIPRRLKEHLRSLGRGRHHSRYLQRAWNKHGPASFEVCVLCYCREDELIGMEQAYIDALGAVSSGYNMAKKAAQPGTSEWTPERREAARLWWTPERRAKMREVRAGKRLSDEWKRKVADGVRVWRNGPEQRAWRARCAERRAARKAAKRAAAAALVESQKKPIKMGDTRTGEVVLFESHNAAARHIGCHPRSIRDVVHHRDGQRLIMGWMVVDDKAA